MDADHTATFARCAVDFARKLTGGQFSEARELLTESLRELLSEQALKAEYAAMIDYGNGPPEDVVLMNTLSDWPDKKTGDLGWAYVAISGKDYSEAVTVVVCEGESGLRIREIEWGRP